MHNAFGVSHSGFETQRCYQKSTTGESVAPKYDMCICVHQNISINHRVQLRSMKWLDLCTLNHEKSLFGVGFAQCTLGLSDVYLAILSHKGFLLGVQVHQIAFHSNTNVKFLSDVPIVLLLK